MAKTHLDLVKREFAKQAAAFGESGLTLAKRNHLRWMVDHLGLRPDDDVLDVAAGTGHLSRAMAPFVRRVIAFDLTAEMLAEARLGAERAGLTNIDLARGRAEELPYPDGCFDMVATRLAVHHFEEPRIQIEEMARVCRPGGRVAVIDLVAPDDPVLAASYNRLERRRDPSHVRALSRKELVEVVGGAGTEVVHCASREVAVDVQRWLDLTRTPAEAAQAIGQELKREIEGSGTTGLRPFLGEGALMFMQTWRIVLAVKPAPG